MSYVDKFYGTHYRGKSLGISMKRFEVDLQHRFLNDNDIIKIIYQVSEKVGVIPNSLELSLKGNLPPEVMNVVNALNSSHKISEPTPEGLDPFKYIRSRYDQFDGDMDEYVESLAQEYKSAQNDYESSKSSDSPDNSKNS